MLWLSLRECDNGSEQQTRSTAAVKALTMSTILDKQVLRILHFLTRRRPSLRIWHHDDPYPHLSLVNVFWVIRALEGTILKLDIRGAFFLTFLSKFVAKMNWANEQRWDGPWKWHHQKTHNGNCRKRGSLGSMLFGPVEEVYKSAYNEITGEMIREATIRT